MNRGQRSRQGPKRKPLLVNLSSDDEEVQFVQQIGPSGTRHTSRGASRGRGQGRGSNIGQIRPNFGKNQNKSLPSTSHQSSSTRGRGFLRGQPSWPRGKPITNRKQPVVATIKVANNSNNNLGRSRLITMHRFGRGYGEPISPNPSESISEEN